MQWNDTILRNQSIKFLVRLNIIATYQTNVYMIFLAGIVSQAGDSHSSQRSEIMLVLDCL